MFVMPGDRQGRKRASSSALPALLGANSVTTPGDGFTYYTFTANGTLIVPGKVGVPILRLIVGGGGSGKAFDGTYYGGGGPAGLVRVGSAIILPGAYPVVVGAGGATVLTGTSNAGVASSFNGVTAAGGLSNTSQTGGTNADYPTGRPTVDGVNGGGGNGSTGIGGSATHQIDGDNAPVASWRALGGPGYRWINGVEYARGGLAGSYGEGGTVNGVAGARAANTGDGGLGGSTHGWAGGSGIVIIAVKTP